MTISNVRGTLTFAILVGLAAVSATSAQSATPEPVAAPIDPAECTVEPRPVENLRRLPELIPDPAIVLALGTPAPLRTLPTGGKPANPELVEAVTEVLHKVVACTNAFDILRTGALMTDEQFLRSASGPGPDGSPEILEAMATPRPLPREIWGALPQIKEVRELPDGRVVVSLGTGDSAGAAVFVKSNDRYLLADSFAFAPEETAARRLALLISIELLDLPGHRAFAKIETPVAPPVASDRAVCTVTPRPREELLALANEGPGLLISRNLGTLTPLAEPIEYGTPADTATIEAVTQVVSEQVACANAGDVPRLTALMSDGFLSQWLGGLSELAISDLATPRPLTPAQQSTLIAVEDVRMLPDGRVSAIVLTDTGTSQRIFDGTDGRYLVDDNISIFD
jgi:hypothetical protein